MVVYKSEVAVLALQGELELGVWWRHILVCCGDPYHQLDVRDEQRHDQCGLGVASWGSRMDLDMTMAACRLQHHLEWSSQSHFVYYCPPPTYP